MSNRSVNVIPKLIYRYMLSATMTYRFNKELGVLEYAIHEPEYWSISSCSDVIIKFIGGPSAII
jgi:hypothetical protein